MNAIIKPSEEDLSKITSIVESAMSKVEKELEFKEEISLDVKYSSNEYVIERMDGVAGKTFSKKRIVIEICTDSENWKPALENTVYHEAMHTWFYQKLDGFPQTLWQYIIDEAMTQNFAENLKPGFKPGWRNEHSVEDIKEYWPKIKENLDRPRKRVEPLYHGGNDFPDWLGYSVSYQIGKKLLEEDKESVRDLSSVSKEELIRTGDDLFT